MKIVVFGAGGFVGGWICEELSSYKEVELSACVRQWASAVRLARRGMNISRVDLEDRGNVHAAICGAAVVINVSMPSPSVEPDLALRLYSACVDAGVDRFVQFSSAAVYGDAAGLVDESRPVSPNSPYGHGKVQMEQQLLHAAAASKTRLFILRPSIIYGPFSDAWTARFARRIVNGRWRSLGWAGEGICNLIHAQDLASATALTCFSEIRGSSHVLNINGPEVVTWNEYIDRFGEALDIDDRLDVSPLFFTTAALGTHAIRKTGSWLKQKGLRRPFENSRALFHAAQSVVNLYPAPDEISLFRQRGQYSNSRATDVIGFNPTVSLAEGLRQSAAWCRVHGVI